VLLQENINNDNTSMSLIFIYLRFNVKFITEKLNLL